MRYIRKKYCDTLGHFGVEGIRFDDSIEIYYKSRIYGVIGKQICNTSYISYWAGFVLCIYDQKILYHVCGVDFDLSP